ncbi:MAG: hypothetical protein MUE85_12185 [Microscillaceae bacterium]|jgi:hypothetical protein|nr:hypothetical protein [Microscillaceae bacterium]
MDGVNILTSNFSGSVIPDIEAFELHALLESRKGWTRKEWLEKDPESYRKLLKKINAVCVPESYANHSVLDKSNQNTQNWTYEDWAQNNPEGLVEMRKKEPEKFNQLFNASFNEADITKSIYEGKIPQSRQSWTYTDWEQKDSEGLKNLMKTNQTLFNQLFEAEYGKN